MEFDVPTGAATELAAAYLQAAIMFGLALLFLFLYQRYRKPYFGWFAVAWLLYMLRIGAIVSFLTNENWIWLYWHQVITGWTALALLWATLVFSKQLRWNPGYVILLLFSPLWSYVAIYRMDNFLLAAGPAVVFLSGATLWTGWTFFRHHRRVVSPAAAYLAVAFLAWGLHHLDYPFLRARGAWNPWGYYLDILFVLAIGAGVLLLVLEDLQRGLGALSALSGDLQRRDSVADVVEALLRRTMTLTAVRGSAIYLRVNGKGEYVRGAGLCAHWAGTEPVGAAATVIERVLATGRPETVSNWRHAESDAPPHAFATALPVLRGNVATGALIIVGDARDPFAALDTEFLVTLGQQVGAALENADLYRRLEARRAELERLAARMVQQHEEERRRLSRELHDETAQVFSAVKLQLGLMREVATPELAARLDRALELTDTGMRSIRNVTNSLRPPLLDELGLLPALRALVEDFQNRTGIAFEFRVPDALPVLSETAEVALYRALQEGLANVARHADARRVEVTISVTPSGVELCLSDDGRGLPPNGPIESLERRGHMGLAGMRERITALGGEVTVSNGTNGGAQLIVCVPRESQAS